MSTQPQPAQPVNGVAVSDLYQTIDAVKATFDSLTRGVPVSVSCERK